MHFLRLQSCAYVSVKVKSESESFSVVSNSLQPHGLCSPWNFPGQNTGGSSLALLQGIFPIQGLNPGLPHCRQLLYQLSHKGSAKILEWVAYPFSSGSSWPRNRPGSPALQADSLPTEYEGSPYISVGNIDYWSCLKLDGRGFFYVSFSCVFSFGVTFLCTSEGEPSLSFFLGKGRGRGWGKFPRVM